LVLTLCVQTFQLVYRQSEDNKHVFWNLGIRTMSHFITFPNIEINSVIFGQKIFLMKSYYNFQVNITVHQTFKKVWFVHVLDYKICYMHNASEIRVIG